MVLKTYRNIIVMRVRTLSSQLDRIYKKNARGQYVYWIFGFGLGIFSLVLAYLQVWFATIVVLGISCLWFYRGYKKHQDLAGNICKIAQVNPTKLNQETKKHEDKPERVEKEAEILPILEYLAKKYNPHVLITGNAGIGKTTLMTFLINLKRKLCKEVIVVFNFKANDLYLDTSNKIIDVAQNPPDPFVDKGANSAGFDTAYHIVPDKQGFMAIQVQAIYTDSLSHAKNFDEQIRYLTNLAGQKGGEIARNVLTQVRPLVCNTSNKLEKLDLSKDLTLVGLFQTRRRYFMLS